MKNIAIIDERMSEKCRISLENEGFRLIFLTANANLDVPISAHPDIFMFKHENYLVIEQNTGKHLKKHLFEFCKNKYIITFGEPFNMNAVYPDDCAYNFAVCGKNIIGNINCADKHIKGIIKSEGLNVIETKQGYAKCNICIVSDNAIITEDKGIAKVCKSTGIDVLLLETNSVKLNGYKYGFIGGASGKYKNKLYFCGSIEKHPEYLKIFNFCSKYGVTLVSLSDEDLYDYGSIIIL